MDDACLFPGHGCSSRPWEDQIRTRFRNDNEKSSHGICSWRMFDDFFTSFFDLSNGSNESFHYSTHATATCRVSPTYRLTTLLEIFGHPPPRCIASLTSFGKDMSDMAEDFNKQADKRKRLKIYPGNPEGIGVVICLELTSPRSY